MLPTSAAYKTAIKSTDRQIKGYIEFNGDNDTRIEGTSGLVSITHHANLSEKDRPMFGCACSSYCEVQVFNYAFDGMVISLPNSYFDAYIGVVLPDTTTEFVFLGRFWISDVNRGEAVTSFTGYDVFGRLSQEYVPTVTKGGSGYAIVDILNDIITQCNLGFTALTGSYGYVQELYKGTCRQVVGWLYNVSTKGYRDVNLAVSRLSATGAFNTRSLSDKWTTKDSYTINDTTIYLDGLKVGDTFTVSSVVTGTADNPVSVGSGTGIVGENPYMDSTLATETYNMVNGIAFTPMTIEFRGDPSLAIGDIVKVTHGLDSYYCYIQKFTTTFNGGLKQTIECFGDTEYHYEMSTSPTQAQIRTVSNMAQEIQEEIETARNGVCTQILDTDGSWKEFVIANNVDLSSATSVWRWNINGLAHSTAYSGGTYNFAVDMNGRIIANAIQTGLLTDSQGKNSWNLDTGSFTITDGSINIVTNSETTDKIVLSHNEWTISLSPLEWHLTNTSINQELIGQAGSIYGYIHIGGVRTRTAQLASAGGLVLGANGSNGYIRLDGAANYMAYMRVANGGEVGLADSSGTNIATIGGSNRSILLYDSSGNTSYQLDTPTRWLTINNSSNTRTVLLNGSSGGINLSNGTQYMSYTAGSAFGIYNGTSKYTALIWPDADGAGQFVLGDGTGTKWRTTLTNTGLTFRDSSDTVTATYPATGQEILDSTDLLSGANLASATQTSVRSIALTPGKYLLIGYVCFNANATGVRVISVSDTTNSYNPSYGWNARQGALPSGWYTTCATTMPVTITANKTYYLVAYQNSGSALGLTDYQLKAIKLL